MAVKWIKTSYPGVRFYRSDTKKYKSHQDQYFTIRYKHLGKSKEEGVGWRSDGVTPEICNSLRAEIKQNIRTGIGPQSLKEKREEKEKQRKIEEEQKKHNIQSKITFSEAALSFLSWSKKNKRSFMDDYSRYYHHLAPEFGSRKLNEITKSDITSFKETLKKKRKKNGSKISPATVNQCLALTRRIFNHASEFTITGQETPLFTGLNPAAGVKMEPVDNQRWRILTRKEVDSILNFLKKPEKKIITPIWAEELHVIVKFGIDVGARLGEITSLKKEHIIPESNVVRLVDTKHGSRSVFPSDEVILELARRKEVNSGLYIFPGKISNQPINKDFVVHKFVQIADFLGLNNNVTDRRGKITFYSLRHTYGTWQIYNGMNIFTLSRLMGHTQLNTTMRYLHLAEDFKAQEASRARNI